MKCAYIFDGYEAVVSAEEGGSDPVAMAPAAELRAAGSPAAGSPEPVVTATPVVPPASAARPVRPAPAAPVARTEPSVAPPSEPARTSAPPDMPSVVRHRQPVVQPAHKPAPAFIIPPAAATTPRGGRHDAVFKIPEAAQAAPEPGQPGRIYVEPRRVAPRPAERESNDIFGAPAPAAHAAVRVFWGVLIAAGLLLLAAQLIYVYRAQIANNFPASRSVLERTCIPVGCTIAYSRRIDLISITSSSLQASGAPTGSASEAAPASMTLQLTMRNNHDKPQEWPTLVLDLTDFSGTLVARKNLGPGMYLPPETARRPFEARSEVTFALPITLTDLKINGYHVDKFFP